jgi:Na+/proline symporter
MVGIFSGALLSALIATIDSILLAVSALMSRNFLIPVLKIHSEKKKLMTSRLVVLGAGLVAYLLAAYSEGIYDLLETASSFGTAGILIITLVGLWSKFGDHWSALAALVVGLVTTPVAEYVFEARSPFLVSVLFAGIAYLVTGLSSRLVPAQPQR